jgi:hypothetical protein
MKFTEKYEILELLTSGRVSTFLARERATQAQAVVHTFECPANFAVESRVSSILKHFASIAPSPAEPVIEVGFDEGSSSAYVVTKVPSASALQSWVHSYRSFSVSASGAERKKEVASDENATAELSASEVEQLLRQSGRPKTQRPPEASPPISTEPFSVSSPADPSRQKGEFTRLFEEPGAFERLTGRGAPGSSAPAVPPEPVSTSRPETPTNFSTGFATDFGTAVPPVKGKLPSSEPDLPEPGLPKPGSFTQEFFSGTDDASDHTAFGGGPAPEQTAVKAPGAFTKEFLAISGKSTQTSKPAAEERASWEGTPSGTSHGAREAGNSLPISPMPKSPVEEFRPNPEVQKSSTGEFTSFFRGPFEQPSPSEKPVEYPEPVQASPPPSAGDFTQMFGPETRLEKKESPRATTSQPEPSKTPSFTQIFTEEAKGGAKLGDFRLDPDPLAPASLKPSIASTASPSGMPPMFSSTASPGSSGGGFSPSEARRGSSGGENTFLNQPGRSDATNVFKPRGAEAPPVEPEAPSGPSEFTMFLDRSQLRASLAPPANPAGSNPAARAPVAMPPMPSYTPPAPPPMPQMALPQVPPVPRPAAPLPGRAASNWPLITVLIVLLAIAALLVMYFALKH